MVKIYAMADIGEYPPEVKKMLTQIRKDNEESKSSYLSIVGDNFYYDGVETKDDPLYNKFNQTFSHFPIIAFPVLGNHDYIKDPKAQIQIKRFGEALWNFPNFYYFKKIGKNTGCWFIDSQILAPEDPDEGDNPYQVMTTHIDEKIAFESKGWINEKYKHYKWLKDSLKENKDLKYKFVFGHYPMVSLGYYKGKFGLSEVLLPLFKKYDVRAYISGHDHNAQHLTLKYKNHIIHQVLCAATMHGSTYFKEIEMREDHMGNEVKSLFFSNEVCFLRIHTLRSGSYITFINDKGEEIYNVCLNKDYS